MTDSPRFTVSNPGTPEGYADWHVYDHRQRISVATLVREANRLQRRLRHAETELAKWKDERCTVPPSGRQLRAALARQAAEPRSDGPVGKDQSLHDRIEQARRNGEPF